MANEERKKEDLYIKDKRKSKNFFVTSSAAMNDNKERTKNTISSSVFTKMKADFDSGDFLLDEHLISQNGSILYMMQQIQEDLEDVYNEVSASAFEASFFPFATIDSGSFGVISSSLIPGIDNKYDLGSSGKEWKDLFIDGTANVDAINLNGTAISRTAAELNAVTSKLPLSGGTMKGLIRPIVQTVNGAKLANPHDVRVVDIIEIAAGGKAWTLTTATSAHAGQKLTIIALTAGTIVHGKGNAAAQFQCLAGKNLIVAINTAVTFITNSNGLWYQVV